METIKIRMPSKEIISSKEKNSYVLNELTSVYVDFQKNTISYEGIFISKRLEKDKIYFKTDLNSSEVISYIFFETFEKEALSKLFSKEFIIEACSVGDRISSNTNGYKQAKICNIKSIYLNKKETKIEYSIELFDSSLETLYHSDILEFFLDYSKQDLLKEFLSQIQNNKVNKNA